MQRAKITAGIVGARGYSGLDLCRILLNHPEVELAGCFTTEQSTQWKLSDDLPESKAAGVKNFSIQSIADEAKKFSVIFLATPAEVSMELAPKILNAGSHVIDLSGAFRLPKNLYEKYYGHKHTSPEWIEKAIYGLSPWANFFANKAPQLIANPGCYATSIQMALIPLLKSNLIDPQTLVIDAKSGVSGAGRKAAENLLFNEVTEDILPYKVGSHQHLPEIIFHGENFCKLKQGSIDPHFVTHLLPVRRGISSGIYAKVRAGVTSDQIAHCYTESYSSYPLIKHGVLENFKHLKLTRVKGSARTHLGYTLRENKLFVFSNIDNLMKGAASQAVENFNRLYDFSIATGLEALEGNL